MVFFRVALVAAAGLIHGASAALKLQPELVRTAVCEQEQQEMDTSTSHPKKLGFIVHRKTGFIMSAFASKCFSPSSKQVHHMMDPSTAELDEQVTHHKKTRYVHLARDPLDLAVSNFLYNKFTSHEQGTLSKGTAKGALYRCKNHCEKAAFEKLPPYADSDESTREYLERVNNHTGLLETLCETRPIVDRMLGHRQWCEHNKDRCMQVYLNDIMVSSEAFMSTFKKIAKFAGFKWTPELEECLSYQDVNSPNFGASSDSHAGHCSMHYVSAERRNTIKADAQKHDTHLMGGYYQKATKTLLDIAHA